MLFVDTREPKSIVLEAALGLPPGDEIQRVELPAGDLLLATGRGLELSQALSQGFLIERKTASDFLASLADGRLFHQALEMSQTCPRPLIAVVGKIYPAGDVVSVNGRKTGWSLWSVRMAMLRLQMAGIPIVEIGNRDLPDLIRHLFSWLQRDHHGVPRKIPDPLKPMSQEAWFLAQIPGIGQEKAAALMNDFGSVAECLCALSDGRATRVKGVGKGLISKARVFLGLKEGTSLCLK